MDKSGDQFVPGDVLKVVTETGDWTIQTIIGAEHKASSSTCIQYTMLGDSRIAGWIDLGRGTFAREATNGETEIIEITEIEILARCP